MNSGSFKIVFAKFLIATGIVAENSKVCLSFGKKVKISLISSKNPISSISSASSRITNFGFIEILSPLNKSRNLPGVATITDEFSICFNCLEYD
jgi:hypothetical protein